MLIRLRGRFPESSGLPLEPLGNRITMTRGFARGLLLRIRDCGMKMVDRTEMSVGAEMEKQATSKNRRPARAVANTNPKC